jgi:hypothetical protein
LFLFELKFELIKELLFDFKEIKGLLLLLLLIILFFLCFGLINLLHKLKVLLFELKLYDSVKLFERLEE